MEKEFFAIYYTGETKTFIHEIIYGQSKKIVKASMREKGYTIKGIFSQKDINSILNYEFTDVNVSDATIVYLREHLDFWNDNKRK